MSRDGGGRSSQGHLGRIPGGGSRFPEFDMFPQGGDGAARIYFSNADVTLNFIPLALFAFSKSQNLLNKMTKFSNE